MKGVSQSFIDRADSAAFYEAWVGATLSRAGLYTLHHPFKIDGKDHGQTWDLDVGAYPPSLVYSDHKQPVEDMTPVEVKSVNLSFHDRHSYPFEMLLICSQNSWQRKWPGRDKTQRDFLFVSRKTGAILWLPKGVCVELGVEVVDMGRSEVYKAVRTHKGYLRPLADFVEEVSG